MSIVKQRVEAAFKELAKDTLNLVREVMASDVGINDKIHKNTLVGSNLYKQAEVRTDNIEMIELLLNSYIGFIEWERPKEYWKTAPPPKGGIPPYKVILEWATRKGIPNSPKDIQRYRWSVYYRGHKARPITKVFFEQFDERFMDKYADDLFQALISPLNEYFSD